MTEYKTCSKCRQNKSVDEFNVDRQKIDNLQSRCRVCNKEVQRAYYEANREKVALKQKEYRSANAEKVRALISDWTARHPEQNRQKALASYHRNKHKKRDKSESWHRKNPQANREKTARREARKLENPVFTISKKEMVKIYASACLYCGSKDNIQADHVVPIRRGGSHGIGNLVPACRPCNQSKGSKLLSEWLLWKTKTPTRERVENLAGANPF